MNCTYCGKILTLTHACEQFCAMPIPSPVTHGAKIDEVYLTLKAIQKDLAEIKRLIKHGSP